MGIVARFFNFLFLVLFIYLSADKSGNPAFIFIPCKFQIRCKSSRE